MTSPGQNNQPDGQQRFVDALRHPAVVDLAQQLALPASYLEDVCDHVVPLLQAIERRITPNDGPVIIGLNGCQGSGKSTLARFISILLHFGASRRVVTLSIDDFYLPQDERLRLARDTHPLFATRGVPGTHDVALLHQVLDALLQPAGSAPVEVPVFDKAADDRCPSDQWRTVAPSPDVILFEGWCVGCRPQTDRSLINPVNELEREEDADGVWRHSINVSLAGSYRTLFERIDLLMTLKAPSFNCVYAWRSQQEKMLARQVGVEQVMNEKQLMRFISHYQRLTEHQLETLDTHADAVLDLDKNHRLVAHRGAVFATPS